MSRCRVALIFDDRNRPETTGVYCRRALEGLAEVVHFHPDGLEQIPRQGFDLYLNIDDGLMYRLPEDLRPCAWWAIDTHLNFAWCLEKARDFELVFAAQRDGAEQLQVEGIASACWLPLACDPEIHRKLEVPKVHDIAFVGNLFPGPRGDLVNLLRRRFRNAFVGRAYFEEMARVYSASRLVFNCSVRNDVNMRVFEAMACGSLLMTNDLVDNGQAELFRDGVHLATYRDPEDLLDKVAYYLTHESLRERIAAAGRAEVLARHTYRHRMEEVLKHAEQQPWSIQPGLALQKPLPTQSAGPSYYGFARPELLGLVPESARRVLDVGCGVGMLGESIKARQEAVVVGIEINPAAASEATRRLDEVRVGDVEELELDFDLGSFDCVVCGDVIEHLERPAEFLGRAAGWLGTGGVLVASLPNARHHSVASALLEGNWTYESAGLLDETHLSFFTRRDILDLFSESGFDVALMGVVPGPGYDVWQVHGFPGEVRAGRLHIGDIPPEEAEEFYAYQYLVVARPKRGAAQVATKAEREIGSEGAARAETPSPLSVAPGPERTKTGNAERRHRPAMRFTQDFVRDFDQVDFWGRPFALARFGDGERAICRNAPIASCDGWAFDGRASRFSAELNDALRCDAPDYYLGISDGCCDREARDWFLERVRVPRERLTFANLFVNGNYQRFRRLDLSGLVLVSSHGADFAVPEDVLNSDFDLDGLVEQLLGVDRPILVAAGPAACLIVHKYWMRADPETRQAIVDVGSAIDEMTKGVKTRGYHQPGSPTSGRICQW